MALRDFRVSTKTVALAWGDFDGDGWMDLAEGNSYGGDTGSPSRLLRNNGDGSFTTVSNVFTNSVFMTTSIAWGDLDRDGEYASRTLNPQFEPPFCRWLCTQSLSRNSGPRLLHSLDLVHGISSGFNRVLRNDGNGHFVEIRAGLVITSTWALALVDVDGDSDLECVLFLTPPLLASMAHPHPFPCTQLGGDWFRPARDVPQRWHWQPGGHLHGLH